MRIKHFWAYFPLPAKMKLFWDRLTLSRLTICYFVFSVVHATVQVAIQARAFSINAMAAGFLQDIVQQGNATANGFMVYGHDLRLCTFPPTSLTAAACEVIWDGTPANDTKYTMTSSVSSSARSSSTQVATPSFSSRPSSITIHPSPSSISSSPLRDALSSQTTPSVSPKPTPNESAEVQPESLTVRGEQVSGVVTVNIPGLGFKNNQATLDRTCLWVLNQPLTELRNSKREDSVFIAFQFWVLGMSIVALLNESIPHVLATLFTHILATSWSAFMVTHTASFAKSFKSLVTQGACNPIDLLPTYWGPRGDAEIASLVLNVVALVTASFLSWKLIKSFGWLTFKRIGASRQVNRQYTVVLVLAIAIQLGAFFIVVSVGLWIDQLYNGAIGRLATNGTLYKTMLILVLILLFPWLAMGWFASRRELKIPLGIFLGLSFGYLVGWGAMFVAPTFRWTFVQWAFFALMTCMSVFLTICTLVCGGICFIGFGRGLPQRLCVEGPEPGDDFEPVKFSEVEKADFSLGPVPTLYSASSYDPPAEGSVPYATRHFQHPNVSVVGHNESPQDSRPYSVHHHLLSHSGSISSHISTGSTSESDYSVSSDPHTTRSDHSGHSRSVHKNRWVIE